GSLEGDGELERRPPRARTLAEVRARPAERRPTGCAELDRVLGGGVVPGSAVLVGGEPGIGKSTLLLAAAARCGGRALYVAGEESPDQVALRARRLGIESDDLLLLDRTDTTEIGDAIDAERPSLCVIDSVQTVRTEGVKGSPGGPSQMRAAAAMLVPRARATGTALFLVGQVTKVGGVAGPRALEHAVDAVLLFEGDRHLSVRALRAVKNRFGAIDEIGLFEMREDGLHEVQDASRRLLADRGDAGPGTAVAALVEGRRALCVEVQALLVGKERAPPRRRAQGVDPRRVDLLVGVVESLFAPDVAGRDAFVNVVGGLDAHDRGLDLAVACAVLGAQRGWALEPASAVFGEVGLRGEVRPVPRMEARLKEARAAGFRRVFAPRGAPALEGIEVVEVRRVDEALPPPPRGENLSGLPP
ncbi:MAG: DNA repair protein RadA, partial [Planctomycetota bacterium]